MQQTQCNGGNADANVLSCNGPNSVCGGNRCGPLWLATFPLFRINAEAHLS